MILWLGLIAEGKTVLDHGREQISERNSPVIYLRWPSSEKHFSNTSRRRQQRQAGRTVFAIRAARDMRLHPKSVQTCIIRQMKQETSSTTDWIFIYSVLGSPAVPAFGCGYGCVRALHRLEARRPGINRIEVGPSQEGR